MTDAQHVQNQVTDYALGLQSQSERRRVEAHAAVCAMCRQAIIEERQLAMAVRETIQVAASPDLPHLRELMPPPPRQLSWQFVWQRQLAPVALFLILLAGGLGLWRANHRMILVDPSPTSLAATATLSDALEATVVRTQPGAGGIPALTVAATAPTQTLAAATPAPIPTPSSELIGAN